MREILVGTRFASLLCLLSLLACAVATRDPNRMVATAYHALPGDVRFVVVQADDLEEQGLELFQELLGDEFSGRGFSRASSPDDAEVAVIYSFECLDDKPRSTRAKEQVIGVPHLKLSIVGLGREGGPERGTPFWSATGSTEDPGCNPTQSGLWLVPRMLEFLGQSVDPARALEN